MANRRLVSFSRLGKCAVVIASFLVFCGGLYLAHCVFAEQHAVYATKHVKLLQATREIKASKASLVVLEAQCRKLQSPVGIEDAAREKLGMVRPGEIVYVVEGSDKQVVDTNRVVPPNTKAEPQDSSFWFKALQDTLF